MPRLSEDRSAPHQSRFIDMLDAAFRHYGAADGLPPRLREAVAATPRHRFVHRFRIGDGPLQDADADPNGHLDAIYSDAVMRHVDAAGELLPSSNSQPSYVLWLLHLLGLERGQAVLEFGSGSGWLAAVMARLVASAGRVTGIELIAELVEQSRKDLAALQIGNVGIIAGDGTRGHVDGAPYDRAIITAATWDVPLALFAQLRDGGCVLVPIELCSGDGCDVTVLQRQRSVLVAVGAVPGWFVPLRGEGQDRGGAVRSPEDLPFWASTAGAPIAQCELPLGFLAGGAAPSAAQFRAFLGRTERGLLLGSSGTEISWRPGLKLAPFGLADEAEQSVALWDAGKLTAYGGTSAAKRLARAYCRWTEAGLPGMDAFGLEVHRAEGAPVGSTQLWVEQRGGTALIWRLKPGMGGWRCLLASEASDG